MSKKIIIPSFIVLISLLGGFLYFRYQWVENRLERSQKIAQETASNAINLDDLDTNSSPLQSLDSVEISSGEVSSSSLDQSTNKVLATGVFKGYKDYQPNGSVKVSEKGDQIIIEFEAGFSFSPNDAPDPFVYIAPNPGQKTIEGAVLISKLQSTAGRQAYSITQEQYKRAGGQIIIWCEAFEVYMGGADLAMS